MSSSLIAILVMLIICLISSITALIVTIMDFNKLIGISYGINCIFLAIIFIVYFKVKDGDYESIYKPPGVTIFIIFTIIFILFALSIIISLLYFNVIPFSHDIDILLSINVLVVLTFLVLIGLTLYILYKMSIISVGTHSSSGVQFRN